MLTGNGPADIDTHLEYLRAKLLSLLKLTRLIGIVQNQWMKVAVTCMKYIHAPQAILR